MCDVMQWCLHEPNCPDVFFITLLAIGERGEGKTTCKPLHYKGNPIHRVVKGFIIQGGDFENGEFLI